MITQKLAQLGSRLAEGNSHHLFVRIQTREGYITGPLQGMAENGNGTVTCFLGENLKTDVVEIPRSELVDVVLFCDAERKPLFLKDFDAEFRDSSGELSFQAGIHPGKTMYSDGREQIRQSAVAACKENAAVLESE